MIHGIRATYQNGCRCLLCRSANAQYTREHAPAGWTSSQQAQGHLKALMRAGVGLRRCAELSGLSVAHLQRIRNGQQITVKQETAAKILAIRPSLAHGQKVNSYYTRKLISSLIAEDFSRKEIARRLGLRSMQLRFHPTVTVRNALKVKALWLRITDVCLPRNSTDLSLNT